MAVEAAPAGRVVVLAGGTGGAKLAAGLQTVLGAGLTVIANTADDIEILGVHVSPDPDLVTYWLNGEIDAEQGWGIAGDTANASAQLRRLGAPAWFGLTDRDLATCLERASRLGAGARQTDAQREISAALGAAATVLPMCDEPVRTRVRTPRGWRGLQQFLIQDHAEPEILGLELKGIAEATLSPEVATALSTAELIVIGPSNPVISIGPILAVPGLGEAVAGASAPVVAVSPFVGGQVLKGPTAQFMAATGIERSDPALARHYDALIDGFIGDGDAGVADSVPWLGCPVLMDGDQARAALARRVLEFGAGLAQ